MPERHVEVLRRTHTNYLRKVSRISLRETYEAGTKGIVTTAGAKQIPVLLVSLRLLRRTGSRMPVEVVLTTDRDYDDHLCEKLLPRLNAQCRILSHKIGVRLALKLRGSQFRTFAILSSSFENNIFLEADSLALLQPEMLFDSTSYAESGMVLWSNFKRTSQSDLLQRVQGDPQQPHESSRLSVDAGQAMLCKKRHERSLLLSLLYSLYGPSHFYALLAKDDKSHSGTEVLLASADYHSLPSSRVEKHAQAFGYFHSGEGLEVPKDVDHFNTVGLIQYPPDASKGDATARPAFLHWSAPQLDPLTFLSMSAAMPGTPDAEHRMWKYVRTADDRFLPWRQEDVAAQTPHLGLDPEATIFEQMMYVACADLRHEPGMEDACRDLRGHYKTVYMKE